MNYPLGIFVMICVLCNWAIAQSDTISLNEIPVNALHEEISKTGGKKYKLDSLFLSNKKPERLENLLFWSGTGYLKQYGPGGSAGFNLRGSTAQQNLALWNGLPINNPALGIFDVSLLPAYFIDEASIFPGEQCSVSGSGSSGGLLKLNSKINVGSPTELEGGFLISSVFQKATFLKFITRQQKFLTDTRFVFDNNENRFSVYQDEVSGQKTIINNAGFRQLAVQHKNILVVSEKSQLELNCLFGKTNRNLPTANITTYGQAQKEDIQLKLSAQYVQKIKTGQYRAFIGYGGDQLNYSNLLQEFYSIVNSNMLVFEAERKILMNSWLVSAGINSSFSMVNSVNHFGKKQINRSGVNILLKKSIHKFTASAGGRLELLNQKQWIPVGFVGIRFSPIKVLHVKGQIGNAFRNPTLNDLYWNPGGNPNLKPETGLSGEAGTELYFQHQKINFIGEYTYFYREMFNQIVWMPGINNIWSPKNISHTKSRGIETKTNLLFNLNQHKLNLGITTNYIIAENLSKINSNDEGYKKQLIYVPMYSGGINLDYQFKKSFIGVSGVYQGYRYTSSDNYQFLKPYYLWQGRIGTEIQVRQISLKLIFNVNNITDKNIELTAGYPMPLRNYNFSLFINLKSKQKIN